MEMALCSFKRSTGFPRAEDQSLSAVSLFCRWVLANASLLFKMGDLYELSADGRAERWSVRANPDVIDLFFFM